MIIIYCFVVFCIVLLYVLFDVNYFLRMAFMLSWSRLFHKRINVFEKTVHYGICLSTDIDIFLKHMNNARYLRELDFARSCFYDRSGMFREIKRSGCGVVQGATSIRYRRAVHIFMVYKITTQLIYWDEKSIYLEHDFVNVSDNFVHAIALSKQSVIGPKVSVSDIIKKLDLDAIRPTLSDELKLWLDSMEESSMRFKRMRDEELENVIAEEVSTVFLPRFSL